MIVFQTCKTYFDSAFQFRVAVLIRKFLLLLIHKHVAIGPCKDQFNVFKNVNMSTKITVLG